MRTTVVEILEAPVVGNAGSDQELMNDIHHFLVRENEMSEKIQVLGKLDDVMGLGTDCGDITEAEVENYIEEAT